MGGRAGTRGVLFLFPITCSASAKKAFTQLKVEQCGSHSNAWVSEIHSFIYQVLIPYCVWVCQAAWWLLELQCEKSKSSLPAFTLPGSQLGVLKPIAQETEKTEENIHIV